MPDLLTPAEREAREIIRGKIVQTPADITPIDLTCIIDCLQALDRIAPQSAPEPVAPPAPPTPRIVSSSPANGATNVDPTHPLTVTFDRPIVWAVHLLGAQRELIPIALNLAGNTAMLTPQHVLAPNTQYTVVTPAGEITFTTSN